MSWSSCWWWRCCWRHADTVKTHAPTVHPPPRNSPAPRSWVIGKKWGNSWEAVLSTGWEIDASDVMLQARTIDDVEGVLRCVRRRRGGARVSPPPALSLCTTVLLAPSPPAPPLAQVAPPRRGAAAAARAGARAPQVPVPKAARPPAVGAGRARGRAHVRSQAAARPVTRCAPPSLPCAPPRHCNAPGARQRRCGTVGMG